MLDFGVYVARYGECGVQSLVEMMERREGIRANFETPMSLEDRWNAVMQLPSPQQRLAA
jgi:hypothetical protein